MDNSTLTQRDLQSEFRGTPKLYLHFYYVCRMQKWLNSLKYLLNVAIFYCQNILAKLSCYIVAQVPRFLDTILN